MLLPLIVLLSFCLRFMFMMLKPEQLLEGNVIGWSKVSVTTLLLWFAVSVIWALVSLGGVGVLFCTACQLV
jgi:hypothetical protein